MYHQKPTVIFHVPVLAGIPGSNCDATNSYEYDPLWPPPRVWCPWPAALCVTVHRPSQLHKLRLSLESEAFCQPKLAIACHSNRFAVTTANTSYCHIAVAIYCHILPCCLAKNDVMTWLCSRENPRGILMIWHHTSSRFVAERTFWPSTFLDQLWKRFTPGVWAILSHFEPCTLLQFYILDRLHLSTKSLHPQTISVDLPFPRSGISFSALPWKTRQKRLGQDQDLQRRAQSQTLRQDPVSTQKKTVHPSRQIPFLERLARPCQKRATRFQGEADRSSITIILSLLIWWESGLRPDTPCIPRHYPGLFELLV